MSFGDQVLALGTAFMSYHARNDAMASTAASSEEAFRYFRLVPLELSQEKNYETGTTISDPVTRSFTVKSVRKLILKYR